jgi:hypothetical protein
MLMQKKNQSRAGSFVSSALVPLGQSAFADGAIYDGEWSANHIAKGKGAVAARAK